MSPNPEWHPLFFLGKRHECPADMVYCVIFILLIYKIDASIIECKSKLRITCCFYARVSLGGHKSRLCDLKKFEFAFECINLETGIVYSLSEIRSDSPLGVWKRSSVGSGWVCEADLLLQSVAWKASVDQRSLWREGVRGRRRGGGVGQAENGPFIIPAPRSTLQNRMHALSTRTRSSRSTRLRSQEVCVESNQGHEVKSAWSR